MTKHWRMVTAGLAVTLVAFLGACGDDDDDDAVDAGSDETEEATTTTAAAEPAASVQITEPADGATVTSPVTVKMAATGFVIEPAGDGTVTEGHGHFHVMIDSGCVAVGEVVPSDATHVHFGKAQTEAPLELAPGEHTLCLQAGDGAHTALPLTDEIKVTVG